MAHCHCPPHDHHKHQGKYAVIRNPKSGLVLDASEYHVKIQHFTGFDSQLWSVEPVEQGKFFIINKGNGKYLDIEGGTNEGAHLITYGKTGGLNQQWFLNSDETIVSGDHRLAVDICRERYCAGNDIIAYRKHGKPNQHFHFQYQ